MKTLAKALAIASGLMFLLPFGFYLFANTTYVFTEYATFVGGTAGPMAALAGFLFIYLTFQHQQDQLDRHDKQFERQSFENTFFNLLNYHKQLIGEGTNIATIFERLNYSIKGSIFYDYVPDEYGGQKELLKVGATLHDMNRDTLITIFTTYMPSHQNYLAKIIKSQLSILKHIYTKAPDTSTYYRILEFHLSDEEIFTTFYYYVATINKFSSEERKYYNEYAKMIKPGFLVLDYHINWIYADFEDAK